MGWDSKDLTFGDGRISSLVNSLTMKPTKEETTTIYVTPRSLRLIADDIESRMENAKMGDDIPGHAFYGDGFKIILAADQDAWHNHKNGGIWK